MAITAQPVATPSPPPAAPAATGAASKRSLLSAVREGLAPMDSCLSAALYYASLGWRVIPLWGIRNGRCECGKTDCPSAGKHPRLPAWPEKGTTDPDVIRSWWKHWPYANVGIVTGEGSGLVVLDIDPKSCGFETLADLEEEHGALPDTLRVQTGGGGRHYYFIHPGVHVGTTRGEIGGRRTPGVDLRADGGLVVAPPSLHASGRYYLWEV
jgi:putative DNA primase/helicase